MTSKLPTVLELLGKAVPYLADAGIETARLDAEVLLADILAMDRIGLYVNFDRPLEKREVDAYRQALIQRAKRIPLAHIIGKKEFMSLDFKVTPAVLVPRPETELLVETAIQKLKGRRGAAQCLRVVDVGTGSGAIAVTIAKNVLEAEVWAIDISAAALEVAKENAELHGVSDKVRWLHGNLLDPLRQYLGFRAELIVSNPPYVPSGEIGKVSPEVRREPRLALDGGNDGLFFYRELARTSREFLSEGGWICLEIGHDQGQAVAQMFEAARGFADVQVLPDLAGLDRVVAAKAV